MIRQTLEALAVVTILIVSMAIFAAIAWGILTFFDWALGDVWGLREKPEEKTVKISKADIEYALKVCANFRSNGQKYYEHKELLECLDDLYFTNPNAEDVQRQINEEET